jgi:hypothetical protein
VIVANQWLSMLEGHEKYCATCRTQNIVQLAEHKIHAFNLFHEWRTIVTNNNAP